MPVNEKTLQPVETVVAFHAGRVVILHAATTDKAGIRGPLDELLASWKRKSAK